MNNNILSLGGIVRRGHAIYIENLRAVLEPEHNGKTVVIDIDSGKYVVDADPSIASERARQEIGHKMFYRAIIGSVKDEKELQEMKNAWRLFE